MADTDQFASELPMTSHADSSKEIHVSRRMAIALCVLPFIVLSIGIVISTSDVLSPDPTSRFFMEATVNTVQTTLGALREMATMDRVALPPTVTEFILDNGFQHDDTKVLLAPGAVWIEGSR